MKTYRCPALQRFTSLTIARSPIFVRNILSKEPHNFNMQFSNILFAAAFGSLALAEITYTITEASNPTTAETEAYALIKAAMDAAIQRHTDNGSKASKTLTIEYNSGVATADGSSSGNIRFGSDTSYMTERTALHEIC